MRSKSAAGERLRFIDFHSPTLVENPVEGDGNGSQRADGSYRSGPQRPG